MSENRRTALLIGTKVYDDPTFAALRAPDADLEAFAEVLRDPAICAFDQVTVMKDPPHWDVHMAISRFFYEARRDDLLLLYFTGHGMVDANGRLFLCLRNTQKELLRATAVPARLVSDEMDTCKSQRQVLILDCCHAGAFVRGTKDAGGGVGASVGTKAAFEGNGKGRVVLAASDATQFAFEGDQVLGESQASLFTRYLTEGLRTGLADADGSGETSVDELFDYAYDRVTRSNPNQTPAKWTYKQQGEIVLARNPHPVPLRELIQPGLVESLAPDRPRLVREAAVRELRARLEDSRPGVVLAAREILEGLRDDDSRSIAALASDALVATEAVPASEAAPVSEAARPSEVSIAPTAVASVRASTVPSAGVEMAPPFRRRIPRWVAAFTSVTFLFGTGAAILLAAVPATVRVAERNEAASPSPTSIASANSESSAAPRSLGTLEVLGSSDLTLQIDGRQAGPLPQSLELVPGEHEVRVTGTPENEPFRDTVRVAAGAATSIGPIRLERAARQLTVDKAPDVGAARVFIVQDGHTTQLADFPTTWPIRPESDTRIEAYLGGERMVQNVRFEPGQRDQTYTVSRKSLWQSTSAETPPPPPPRRTVALSARLDPKGEEWAALGAIKSGLASCAAQGEPGTSAAYRVLVRPGGQVVNVVQHSGSTFSRAASQCFVARIKATRFSSRPDPLAVELNARIQ